ncbi:hypothetical protein K488DRAFT_74772 [Vararia minispora EC-137]|uniref:Uncharacterized protein n=1 Tax=Vararia minispora EC-137 TaxID=1314806 RepID=A0ACB8Q5U3_9AGAM|nr:hypothetical protein K488DRAFT_74772 [Vararia minispora EC-137]
MTYFTESYCVDQGSSPPEVYISWKDINSCSAGATILFISEEKRSAVQDDKHNISPLWSALKSEQLGYLLHCRVSYIHAGSPGTGAGIDRNKPGTTRNKGSEPSVQGIRNRYKWTRNRPDKRESHGEAVADDGK